MDHQARPTIPGDVTAPPRAPRGKSPNPLRRFGHWVKENQPFRRNSNEEPSSSETVIPSIPRSPSRTPSRTSSINVLQKPPSASVAQAPCGSSSTANSGRDIVSSNPSTPITAGTPNDTRVQPPDSSPAKQIVIPPIFTLVSNRNPSPTTCGDSSASLQPTGSNKAETNGLNSQDSADAPFASWNGISPPPASRLQPEDNKLNPPESIPSSSGKKTIDLSKNTATDHRLTFLSAQTLAIANSTLAKHGLPLLNPGGVSSQPTVGETLRFVRNQLETAQQADKERRWRFTWNKKEVIVVERLGNILKSVDKYTKLMDTAIQHSPQVTALVLAGVKAILQVTLNHVEAILCFETAMAEMMEKLALCDFYAGIYADVELPSGEMEGANIQRLQNSMASAVPELYAAVIVFSVKARIYFEARWVKKMLKMLKPFEIEIQPFIHEIDAKRQVVKACAERASMGRLKDMEGILKGMALELSSLTKLNEISNIVTENHRTLQVLQTSAEDEKIQKLLLLLSPLEPLKRHEDVKKIRLENTSTWLLWLESFNNWSDAIKNGDQRVLCCYGIPGAGKTVMSSVVTDALQAQFAYGFNIGIACLYADYRDQSKQSLEHILGSILYQFLTTAMNLSEIPPEIIQKLEESIRKRSKLSKDDLVALLRLTFGRLVCAFICIDALDELESKTRRQLLQELKELSPSTIWFFFTGRHHVQSEVRTYFEIKPEFEIEITANPDDVSEYLKREIAGDPDPAAMSEELEKDIIDAIMKRSNGMFLLPALHVKWVLDKPTIFERQHALKDLPEDLYTTFKEVIARIQGERRHAELGMRIFMWLHFAYRPLKVEELQDALAVLKGQKQLQPNNIPSKKAMLDSCCGLVIVDEETTTIRFAHFSLQEFFQKYSPEYFSGGCSAMAEICLTYLNCEEVKPHCVGFVDMEERVRTFRFLQYAACNWGYYFKQQQNASDVSGQLAQMLLNHKTDSPPCPIQVLYSFISNRTDGYSLQFYLDNPEFRDWRFWLVPSRFSGIHAAAYFGLKESVALLCEMQGAGFVDDTHRTAFSWAASQTDATIVTLLLERDDADVNKGDFHNRTPLSYAAEVGYAAIVRLLLARGDVDANKPDDKHQTPLSYAVVGGHEEVVRLLLARDDVDANKEDLYGTTPLTCAAIHGHEAIVRLLFARDVDVDKGDSHDRTPLSYAAEAGYAAIVRLLLAMGDVDANKPDDKHQTPLSYAASGGHEEVVRLLLDRDVDVNKGNVRGRTPLSYVAEAGHTAIVRLLLARDVDVNKEDFYGRTPLSYGASGGHEEVVRLLLTRDVDVNKGNANGRTPLSYAASGGHEEVVRLLLLARDVDANKGDFYGRAPLSSAASGGHEEVVRLLLARDVDVNKGNANGRTPISYAASGGHEEVVRLLLARDVDVNKGDSYGRTPLSYAASGGHEEVVRLLLARDVDVNKGNARGRTPLSYAAEAGHATIVRLLLAKDNIDSDRPGGLDGKTPLLYAASGGHEEIIRLLLAWDDVAADQLLDYVNDPQTSTILEQTD